MQGDNRNESQQWYVGLAFVENLNASVEIENISGLHIAHGGISDG